LSALTLAALFSYAAIALTEPAERPADFAPEDDHGARENEQVRAFLEACAKSEAGDPDGMFTRAMAHLAGVGTPIDRPAAAKWLRMAADKGLTQAQFSYGQACVRGEIVPQDFKEALVWLRLAADKLNADAELSLAQMYRDGVGVSADEKESHRWFRLSALHGHPIAQADHALIIFEADDPATHKESAEWLRKSAIQGKPSAMFNLAIMYQRGLGVPEDRITALAWFMVSELDGDEKIREEVKKVLASVSPIDRRKALARTKTIISELKISPIYSEGSRAIDLANEFHRRFARALAGGADDQFELATLFHEGVGTVSDDVEAAIWCRKAAEQGHIHAIRTLATCLEIGAGVEPDLTEMVSWLRRAAEKDDSECQFRLGVCYLEGKGVTKDQAQAEFWTKKAADQGHPIAQSNMGSFILTADDKSRLPEAVKWFRKSAKQGHPKGMFKYGLMLILGTGAGEDRVEGAAWMIACLPEADDDLKSAIKDVIDKLKTDERRKAEAAAIEIQKTL
jgi:TPR repeat protein